MDRKSFFYVHKHMSVFTRGPYGRLAVMLNALSSLNIEIIIINIIIIMILPFLQFVGTAIHPNKPISWPQEDKTIFDIISNC